MSCNIAGKDFKQELSFDKRFALAHNILSKYNDRIPIILSPYSKKDPILSKKRYLVPADITMCKFIIELRSQMPNIKSGVGIYFYVDAEKQPDDIGKTSNRYSMVLVPVSQLMGPIYDKYKDQDGFLYMVYTTENTFGIDVGITR